MLEFKYYKGGAKTNKSYSGFLGVVENYQFSDYQLKSCDSISCLQMKKMGDFECLYLALTKILGFAAVKFWRRKKVSSFETLNPTTFIPR